MPTISLILLTHATPSHIAAFAHCCKHFPLFTQIPIYATLPVISLGRTLLQDIYSSTILASSIIPPSSFEGTAFALSSDNPTQILLQPPTTEEIASYFSLVNPLKYSQPHQPLPSPFSPPLNGLTITAYNAGHSLGGTIWHIQHGMESVVYAVDWNQIRENVFAGAAWLGSGTGGGAEVIEQLRKPTALICSAKGVEKPVQAGGRMKRDDLLLEYIRNALSRGGSVLIPTDSSARVLELAYLLEHAWRKESKNTGDHPFKQSRLYLAGKNVGATMRYARSMIEWMDNAVIQELESEPAHKTAGSKGDNAGDQAVGPFDFKYMRLVERKAHVDKILARSGPRVILASDASLAWGFSKDTILGLASNPANLVILTEDYTLTKDENGEQPRIGQTLWSWYRDRQDGVSVTKGKGTQTLEEVYTDGRELHFTDAAKTLLEGKELVLYRQYQATQRQLQTTQTGGATNLETSADVVDDASSASSSSEESDDDERQGKALNYSTTFGQANKNKALGGKEVQGINVLLKEPGVYDYDVRGKKGRESMFPFATKKRRADEFGELIRPEDYLRAEERDDVDGEDMKNHSSGKNAELGQKRKWDDAELLGRAGRRPSLHGAKKKKMNNGENRQGSPEMENGTAVDSDLSDFSDSETEEIDQGPSKVTLKSNKVTANLRIAFVDFAGIHDQRNMSMLIPLIQPRKLVIVGGTRSETTWLAEECSKKLRSKSNSSSSHEGDFIFTPLTGETVAASMDTNAWTLKLSAALLRKLKWQNVKGLSVATLMGRVAATVAIEDADVDAQRRKRQKMIKDETAAEAEAAAEDKEDSLKATADLPPTLDVIPASMAAATRTISQPLHVGDLRLADLRKLLQSTGHTAEFRGQGTLVVDGLVAVRKSSSGQIEIECVGLRLADMLQKNTEPSFQAVRNRIYDGLAVIAGG